MKSRFAVGPGARTITALVLSAAALILVTRMLLNTLGVEADPSVIMGSHWQNLPLSDLSSDLLGSLWNLHSQPPLWNLILGLFAKACSAEVPCVTLIGHSFNMMLSIVGSVLVFLMARRLGVGARLSQSLGILYTILPSVIFFEHYIFYPHLTSVLFLVQSCALLQLVRTGNAGSMAVAFAAATLLCLTWSLFHPIYLIVTYFTVAWAVGKEALNRKFLVIGLFALAISLAPSIKNYARFNIASNGSWVGFNLSQVAPSLNSATREICTFYHYLDNSPEGKMPSLILNDPDIVEPSKYCATAAGQNIAAHPFTYIGQRLTAALQSLSTPSHVYMFAPVNWSRIGFLPTEFTLRREDKSLRTGIVLLRILLLTFYTSVFLFSAWVIFRARGPERGSVIVLFVPIVAFLTLAHAFNSGEQNRMRHTVELPIWFLASLLIRRACARTPIKLSSEQKPIPRVNIRADPGSD